MLCEVIKEAGVPPGVVNFVFGTGPRTGNFNSSFVVFVEGLESPAHLLMLQGPPFVATQIFPSYHSLAELPLENMSCELLHLL
jgi:hypothetical protein